MLDLDPTRDPQALSRMMTLQASFLRDAGLVREAEALCARAEAYDAFANLMAALRSAPIRESEEDPHAFANVVNLSDHRLTL